MIRKGASPMTDLKFICKGAKEMAIGYRLWLGRGEITPETGSVPSVKIYVYINKNKHWDLLG